MTPRPSTPRLVLASGSARRADVLSQLGLEHVIRPAAVDEAYVPGESSAAHVERLAREKAEAVAATESDALVVGGDTVVLDGPRVLGKPSDPDEAVQMLVSLAGRTHTVLSGLAICGSHGTVSAVARADVRLRSCSEAWAREYVASGEPLDKAGAYGIQGFGAALVADISGDYYSVVGFPVGAFVKLLEECGWRYAFGRLERAAD